MLIATLDAETDPFDFGTSIDPFVWGFFDGETFEYFWGTDANECCERLMEYLQTRLDDELVIYAHNGGKFDFMFLLKYLDSSMMLINGRIAKATLFNGRIELRDSFLIIPVGLKNKFNDYDKMKRDKRELYKNEIVSYLNGDCRELYDLVYNFVERFGNKLTLASTAFSQLRETGYEIKNTNEKFDEQYRQFYFGGRVQCFDVGNFVGDFSYVDINSAYPYAMKHAHWYGAQFKKMRAFPDCDDGSWFATIDAVSHGCLPYRGDDGKLYFPTDDKVRRYYASGWEIKAGFETGTLDVTNIVGVRKPLLTQDFSEYVDKFFADKLCAEQRGDATARLFAKILLNAGYGKFGQDGRNFEEFVIVEQGDWPVHTCLKTRKEGPCECCDRWKPYTDLSTGQSIFRRSAPQYRFYNVATAASITAFVRAMLWRAIHKSDGVLYCDTDSLICREFGGGVIGKNLGEWDLEARLCEAHIAQRKMYALKVRPEYAWPYLTSRTQTTSDETKTASKGVKLNYAQIKNGIKYARDLTYKKESPAFSLKFGMRYFEKTINFSNMEKNLVTNPN